MGSFADRLRDRHELLGSKVGGAMRKRRQVVTLLAALVMAAILACSNGDDACGASECQGTDGKCYGPCEPGATCTTTLPSNPLKTNNGDQCSNASAGGTYCCCADGMVEGLSTCVPPGTCPTGWCTGTDGGCYTCNAGASCSTTNLGSTCGAPTAGVYCCSSESSSGGSGGGSGSGGGGCTAQVCCGGLYECNGACYATCTVGSQPCCTEAECVCYTPCC
jgi:hypothetical protein